MLSVPEHAIPAVAINMRDSAAKSCFFVMISSVVRFEPVVTWTNRTSRWFPAVLAALFLACSGGESTDELPPGVVEGSIPVVPGATSPTAGPSVTATTAACANEAATAADAARRLGTSVQGDVNGDGTIETIALALDPAGAPECSAFVVVDLGTEIAAAPVWEAGPESGLPQPRINGLENIDGRAGDEILIDEAAGASTQFVGAFTFIDGDLKRITARGGIAEGEVAGFENLFPYGGSVGHIDAVDCSGDGIVVSTATPSSDQDELARGIYEVERRFFTLDDGTMEHDETQRSEVAVDELDRYPEFGSAPFGSC